MSATALSEVVMHPGCCVWVGSLSHGPSWALFAHICEARCPKHHIEHFCISADSQHKMADVCRLKLVNSASAMGLFIKKTTAYVCRVWRAELSGYQEPLLSCLERARDIQTHWRKTAGVTLDSGLIRKTVYKPEERAAITFKLLGLKSVSSLLFINWTGAVNHGADVCFLMMTVINEMR